jgi:drug/metabolite transporter (DMT)-like permease
MPQSGVYLIPDRRHITYHAQLHWRPIAVLIFLALIWGANMAIIKVGARELPPLFMAGFRSLVASLCLLIWMKVKGIIIFPSKDLISHGVVIGLLFGTEFGLLYMGLQYTLASRTYILLYTAPFFVALGAHLFLKGDQLHQWKFSGLLLAFMGITVLFSRELGSFSLTSFSGDMMALGAGALWGTTTVYVKKFLAKRILPLQTLFYQLLFSAPLLIIMSLVLETLPVTHISFVSWFSVFYQCIIVAFLSYLVWFQLVHRYPVSLLHAFSFFTPVFGVFLSGAIILGEIINLRLLLALSLVSIGMILVNRTPGIQSEKVGSR